MDAPVNGNGKKLVQHLTTGGVASVVIVTLLGLAWKTVQDTGDRLAIIEQQVKSLNGRMQSLQKRVDRAASKMD